MPRLVQYIDAIARAKKRDVLWVFFGSHIHKDGRKYLQSSDVYYQENTQRKLVIDWLSENEISYDLCGHFANENCIRSYEGQLYVDVPFDLTAPEYLKLERFFENPDGSMRIPGVIFMATSLERALSNSHHDEPGFWEKWADNF